ncbi:DUF3105 domain-containing protein [Parafrigoribacterium mesophilum]|uniref:DUF3105 domain-containing protein n=1 Tax=Parafrigoribacterium mesophilum TaxID=433646 RepID=UPI0031FE3130
MARPTRPSAGNAADPAKPARPLTVKEERQERRQAKVAAFKREQVRAKRRRRLAVILSSVAGLAVVGLVVGFVITANSSDAEAPAVDLNGVQTWDVPGAVHVDPKTVDYKGEFGMDPPAGGPHWAVWLNCGIYTQPQQNERAVHDLEHGAVWVTYNADKVKGEALAKLRDRIPDTYAVLSPYPGLDAPVVASAWGAQVKLTGVDDKRLDEFIKKYWQSPDAPEPGAPCTGGVDGPGRI